MKLNDFYGDVYFAEEDDLLTNSISISLPKEMINQIDNTIKKVNDYRKSNKNNIRKKLKNKEIHRPLTRSRFIRYVLSNSIKEIEDEFHLFSTRKDSLSSSTINISSR